MTDPRDDIDAWLHAEVDPLRPPPGTFERIQKQARRRKRRRALMTAGSAGAAAAVIVLAVVALPRVVPSVLHLKSHPAGNSSVASGQLRSSAPVSTTPTPSSDATVRRPLGSPPPPVPPHFAATSVTFIGLRTGWVIGQAGTPGHCATPHCTSVARTDNAGHTWNGVPAPRTGAPYGSTGVGQIRFLDSRDGWAFGPELWATHDSGQNWTQIPTGGLRVLSLETTGSEAFAVLARCTGTGPGFAAGCTRFFLWSSPAGSDNWRQVAGVAGVSAPAGTAASTALVLTGSQGYWYRPDGTLLRGPVTDDASWAPVSAAALPCLPGPAQADGQPSAGQLAAAAAADLVLGCPASSSQAGSTADQQETIYGSTDGGQTWQRNGTLTTAGPATSLAAAAGGTIVLSTSQCIDASADNGAFWRKAQLGPPGGFSYVGMTSPVQGVAVPADAGLHAVWFTFTGGQAWQSSPVRSR